MSYGAVRLLLLMGVKMGRTITAAGSRRLAAAVIVLAFLSAMRLAGIAMTITQ